MSLIQGTLLFCVLFTLGAVMYMIVQLAANPDVSGEKLATVIGFAGMTSTAIGSVAGYVIGRSQNGDRNEADSTESQQAPSRRRQRRRPETDEKE